VTIKIPDLAEFYSDEDKTVIQRTASLEATDKLIDAALAKVDAAIANNEDADPDRESRITNITVGTLSAAPKSWAEQRADLQRQKRDVQTALDIMARKKQIIDYQAGARLAKHIRPLHDIAARELADALVIAHEKHLIYWTAKRHLLNNGIGIYGLFSSNVDDILGIPVGTAAPLTDYFRDAVRQKYLRAVPESLH